MARGAGVLGKSSLIIAGRLAGAGLLFAAQLLISRLWGAATLGQYLLIVAAINFTAIVMPLGFHIVAGYFAARYAAAGQGTALRRFAKQAALHVAAVAVIVLGVLLFAPLPALAWIEVVEAVRWPFVIGAMALASTYVLGALLVGLRKPLISYAPDAIVRPLGMIVLVVAGGVLVAQDADPVPYLATGLAVVLVASAALLIWPTLQALGSVARTDAAAGVDGRQWWRYALPWMLIVAATELVFDLDLLVLAGYLDTTELAVFGVCARFFVLAAFGLSAVYSIFVPDLFAAEAHEGNAGVRRQLERANLAALGVAVASLAGAAIAGPFALSLFGPAFTAGYPVMLILFSGLLVRVTLGPGHIVLTLRDRPYASLPFAAAGLAAMIGANVALVPALGLTGAALSVLLAMIVWSAGWWSACRRLTGLDVSVRPAIAALARARERISPAE